MINELISLQTLYDRLAALQSEAPRPPAKEMVTRDLSSVYIKTISHDSRRVTENGLYVALAGRNTHGAKFIDQALKKGAIAIALPIDTPHVYLTSLYTEESINTDHFTFKVPLLWLTAQYQRFEMAQLSEWVYASPIGSYISKSQDSQIDHTTKTAEEDRPTLDLIGITGTNGKTTTSSLLADILTLADGDTGLIGTIETRGGGIQRESKMTTMESTDLHAHYRNLLNAGVRRCVMEVSSIGIEEARVAASKYQRAAFLNLSEDHLDYHENMQAYAASKLRLFSELLAPDSLSIVCIDGLQYSQELAKQIIRVLRNCGQALWRYTSQVNPQEDPLDVELYWQSLELSPQGITGFLYTPQGDMQIRSPLMGRFNADNIAIACALAISLDIPISIIQEAVASSQVKGRMEQVQIASELQYDHSKKISLPSVRVDYAHTPDALERAIKALKAHCTGQLWVLFGCGGDRDTQKRPLMGASCAEASGVVLSSDNPRDEDPHCIMNQVVPGLIKCGKKLSKLGPKVDHYWIESDRGLAIHRLIRVAKSNDLILIAGKGHEPYQEVKAGKRLPFSDQTHALQALKWKQKYMMNDIDSLHSEQLCNDAGGVLIFGHHQALSGAVIDTRKLSALRASAFFCLQGQRDGHDFITTALQLGAKTIVVRRDWQAHTDLKAKLENSECAVIAVSDPEKALNLWAQAHRTRVFKGIMIGLTGSNGKTSTKELLSSALAELGTCLATEGNYNNHLGVPLTLLRLRPEHQFAVIEMGMNAPNEITELTRWVKPDLALITTISNAHLEGLGSIEAIAAAKGEIITASIPAPVIMPISIPLHLRKIAQADAVKKALQSKLNLHLYLLDHPQALHIKQINKQNSKALLEDECLFEAKLHLINPHCHLKGSQAQVIYHHESFDLRLNVLGRHQLDNARLALAAGLLATQLQQTQNISLNSTYDGRQVLKKLLKGLATCRPAPLRGEVLSYPRPIGSTVDFKHSLESPAMTKDTQQVSESSALQELDKTGLLWLDCYNANPQSILASVQSFIESGALKNKSSQTLFLIGQIGELGERSAELHYNLGRSLSRYINTQSHLVTVGQLAKHVVDGFTSQGGFESHTKHFDLDHIEQLIKHIKSLNPDYIFVKGSRSVRLERLLKPLHAYRSSL
ncbi:MAG: hypothetical protein CMH49_06560 [Myxococcales bacterium]|nr:hypothetical protein [Myxococcales bacterium]